MYTAIEEQAGSFIFVLHRSPEALDPALAREALAAVGPIVERLRSRAQPDRTAAASERRRTKRLRSAGRAAAAPLSPG